MKWFKHMSDANRDDKLVAIRDEFGLWGVGLYWTIVEMVAEQMKSRDPKPEAIILFPVLCSFAGCKPNKLRRFLELMRNQRGMLAEQNGNQLRIIIPKLLEIKDNYLKDLEETKKKLPSKEVEVEVEEEVDVKIRVPRKHEPPTLDDVKLLWLERHYPAKEIEKFFNYYESNGWRVGKNAMKNWKAAAAGWISRAKEYGNGRTGKGSPTNSVTDRAVFQHGPEDRDRFKGLEESMRGLRTGNDKDGKRP